MQVSTYRFRDSSFIDPYETSIASKLRHIHTCMYMYILLGIGDLLLHMNNSNDLRRMPVV